MKAKITWTRYANGGRENPPTGEFPYNGALYLVRVTGFQHWTLQVTKTDGDVYNWDADVKFLVDEAPDILHPGYQFSLYEDKKCVADGIIV
jgi:hypothetical protein